MEQRKLIKLGNSSFAIALPKEWVDKSGLKKGDNIFLEKNNDGKLTVMTHYSPKEADKEISLDLKEKDDVSLQVDLIGAYLGDHNLFRIKNNIETKKKQRIKELIKNLMSFEIVEETNEEITVKDVLSLEGTDIKMIIRRIDNILRSFFEDIESAMNSEKMRKDAAAEINLADKEITKLYLLVSRIFLKSLDNHSLLTSLNTNSLELFTNWWLAIHLERIGDELKRIASVAEREQAILADKTFQELMNKIKINYLDCINAYHKKDKDLVRGIIANNIKIREECQRFDQDDAALAKTVEKLVSIQDNIFQISKMISYTI